MLSNNHLKIRPVFQIILFFSYLFYPWKYGLCLGLKAPFLQISAFSRSLLQAIPSASLQSTHPNLDLSAVGWGLLSIKGKGRETFLNGLTTQSLNEITPNTATWSCILTNKGRVFDFNMIYRDEEDVKILCSPDGKDRLSSYLNRFIFPTDDVVIQDITKEYHILALLAKQSQQLESSQLKSFHGDIYLDLFPFFNSTRSEISTILRKKQSSVTVAPLPDNTIKAHQLFSLLLKFFFGVPSINREIQAIEDGPTISSTLNPLLRKNKIENMRYNPFELGLADLCILPNKGCYTGQETVSRFSRSLIRSYYKHSSAANGDSYYLAHKSAIRSQLMAIKSLSLSERPISSKKNDKIFDQSGDEVGEITSNFIEEFRLLFPNEKTIPSSAPLSHFSEFIVNFIEENIPFIQEAEIWNELKRDDSMRRFLGIESIITSSLGIVRSRIVSDDGIFFLNDMKVKLETLSFPDYRHIRLLRGMSKEVWSEEKAYQENEENGNSTNLVRSVGLSDEERKRKKLEEVAKKIELMKAKKTQLTP